MPPPPGLPETFLEDHPDAMRALVRRYARTHGPFPTGQLMQRYGVDPGPALRELEKEGALVRGELLPGGTEREWCDSDVLRRVRRASLARLRKEVEAADRTELARFLPSWQNVDAFRKAGAGPDRLREALVPLQGVALTPKVWETDVLPRRLGAYSPELARPALHQRRADLDRGREPRAQRRSRRPLLPRRRPPRRAAARQRQAGDPDRGGRTTRSASGSQTGPSFWLDLVADLHHPAEEIHNALWDLAWAGEVTNDAFAPLRAPRLRAVPPPNGRGAASPAGARTPAPRCRDAGR